MNRRHLFVLAGLLAAIGIGLMVYKAEVLGFPLVPDDRTSLWSLEARITFHRDTPGTAKADLTIPGRMRVFSRLNENFVSRGYGLSTHETDGRRKALWAIRRAQGEQTLYYRLTVYRDDGIQPELPEPPFPPVPQLEEPFASALQDLVAQVRRQSADVETFTSELIQRMNRADDEDPVALFLDPDASAMEHAINVQTLLAGARIPSRVLQTIPLVREARQVEIVPWMTVHNGRQWLYFNPRTGELGLPRDLFVWSWDSEPLIEVSGGLDESIEFWVTRTNEDALSVAERRALAHGSRVVDFSLLDLPLKTRAVYGVLLLIPIGTLLIVILRNIVGIRTFGTFLPVLVATFLPVLVALAFRETSLVYGIILFLIVVSAGLSVRMYLERLHLLLVPRLASVLIVVVLLMIAIGILSYRLGIETGLSIALFPMVILTMAIERMSVVWEERGPSDAMKDAAGTLLVAALSYWVMGLEEVRYLVFVFPEILFVLLAITLLIGRYTGYRLSEIRRFRALKGTGDGS
jgi:hypothetical protein